MKHFNFKRYKRYKFFLIYVIGFIVSTTAIYVTIPVFFNYENSKNNIENKIYKEFNIKSSIKGKIKYRPLPSPRLKINNLAVKDPLDEKINLGEVENVILKIPFKYLNSLDKVNFNGLDLENAQINLNLKKINKYNDYFLKKFKSKNINISSGQIKLFDGTKYLAELSKIKLKYKSTPTIEETTLMGNLFDDNITINFKNKKKEGSSKIFTTRFKNLKFRSVVVLSDSGPDNYIRGNGSFNYNHNKLNLVFEWKDSLIKIKKGDIKNKFLKGKIYGDIKFLPFFNFDLNVDLSSFNFGHFSKTLIKMNNKSINNLFVLNEKINGNLNLNINKIYSSSKLVKSLESRMLFVNQNILIDQLLLDLGKLGAADVTGIVKNENNYSNLSFKKNLFIDNSKYFYSKFGVYNKSTEAKNLFVSGNFNLNKPKIRFNELSSEHSSLSKEDITYYQEEFNEIVLNEGYKSFFDFLKLKEFVNTIVPVVN